MSTLNDLIGQIENPELRKRIADEVKKLNKQKKFGLVFEEHLPECTPLYDVPVKKGATVSLRNANKITDIYKVLKIENEIALCFKEGSNEAVEFPIADLVTIAKFGEPIYPYLKPLDSICNAPNSDLWHTLIEADNYHALQLLEYLYAGKVDCIYIDPPYNTGARDWKYNNDYVDINDEYRHSKWLSMMEKRLKIAKKLLNPDDSVLIVTIDEKEYLHLGCLLEELFPEAKMQMISTVIKPGGSQRSGEFARSDEYIFFIRLGKSVINPEKKSNESVPVPWRTLHRNGSDGHREARPNMFYPIYVDKNTHKIIKFGESLPIDKSRFDVPQLDNCEAVFPVIDNGTEMRWGLAQETAQKAYNKGCLRIGEYKPNKPQQFVVSYLSEGVIQDIESGKAIIDGYEKDGSVKAHYEDGIFQMPTTQWNNATHDANTHGTKLLNKLLGERFSYPKSLYAVHDTIRFFVADKPNAIIIDFFAGSGTTQHAVNLLNAEDGGHRKCIMITNNEISDTEEKAFKARGIQQGDPEWEAKGIAQYVTWPRTICSIKGVNINGESLKGSYIGSDIPMSDGFNSNVAFFKLSFLDKTTVALGMQFKEMLPTLWMKSGAIGECPSLDGKDIPQMLILPKNKMAVLNDENQFAVFAKELSKHPEIETVYLVTDYENSFISMTSELPGKTTYQLYRDYLDNFRINSGRNAR